MSRAADSSEARSGPVDPWCLHQQDFDPARQAHDETLFALANGSLGVRGGFEEAPSATDGSFLAAVFEQNPIHYHERFPGFARNTDTRMPVADGTRIAIWLGDERLDIEAAQWLSFSRELDLRTGKSSRRLELRSASGAHLVIDAERVLPLSGADLLAIRFRVSSIDYAGPIALVSSLSSGQQAQAQGDDPRIGVLAGEGLRTSQAGADEARATLVQHTRHSGITLACTQAHRTSDGLRFTEAASSSATAEQRYEALLTPGNEVRIEKFVAYASANGSEQTHLVQSNAAVLAQATAAGFDAIASEQANTLSRFWCDADIGVEADPASAQALRFNLFHLLQSAGRDGLNGTAAKGLTGEGYEGHCFWDTEAFVLPVMAFTAPEVARAMLRYRYRMLDAARDHALEMNHARGALYPWRTIAGGECSAHYPSGSAAYHINAAIAHGVGLYLDATDDLEFLVECGAEILFETARIWPQVGHFNARRDGAFCIAEVTGPDEYTALVDNNFYTNRMAQRHLRRAVAEWRRLLAERPQQAATLAQRLALTQDEIVMWQSIAERMYLGYDETLGIYAQDDGFLDKPRWPFPAQTGPHRPLLLDYHPLTLYRHQVCKQADVLMGLWLDGENLALDRKRRSFDYYEAVTVHDSTLSASVFGIVANEVGYADKAWRYFQQGLRVDLDDLHGNTDHGVHMAAMAGSWLGLVQGFGGLRVAEGHLHFSPTLPAAWPSYAFNLRWRGRRLRVEVEASRARYTLLQGEPLEIHHAGQALRLTLAVAQEAALAPPPSAEVTAVFPRPCQALIFDLDGVLTDTAHSHYRAWKRLADEIGVPFDLQDNERLKGVDRAASLDIILERATRPFADDVKRTLAERKNRYYVAEIEGFGPQDLFPGVRELLLAARDAGMKTGLASASRNARALLYKLGIEGLFDYVADAALIARAKPDPEIFLTVARALGVDPAACIGVEDAAAGIVAIHAAGMPAIGIGDARVLGQAEAVLSDIAALRLEDFVSK